MCGVKERKLIKMKYTGKHAGGSSVVKEYEIITLKYNGKEYRLYLLLVCAPEDIILHVTRPGSPMFEGKYFYKLIRSKGWQHAPWRTQNKTQLFNVFDVKITKMKWNYTECIRNILSSYPVLTRGLAINLPWPALKHFEVFLISSAD